MSANPTINRQIVLTDQVLTALVFNKQMQNEFPFVKYAARNWDKSDTTPRVRGCQKCRKRRPANRAKLLNEVREKIMELPESRKAVIKSVLGVTSIVMYRPAAGGRVDRTSF